MLLTNGLDHRGFRMVVRILDRAELAVSGLTPDLVSRLAHWTNPLIKTSGWAARPGSVGYAPPVSGLGTTLGGDDPLL